MPRQGRTLPASPEPSCVEEVGPGLSGQHVCKEEAPTEPPAWGSAGRQGVPARPLCRGSSWAHPVGCGAQTWVESSCGQQGPLSKV